MSTQIYLHKMLVIYRLQTSQGTRKSDDLFLIKIEVQNGLGNSATKQNPTLQSMKNTKLSQQKF